MFKRKNTLGTGYFQTGKSLFSGWNLINAILGGVSQIDDYFAPTKGNKVRITSASFVANTGVCSVTTDAAVDTNAKCVISCSAPQSAGTSADKGKYRIVKILAGGTAAGLIDISSEYAAIFGSLVAGEKVFYSSQITNNDAAGQVELNPRIKGSAIIA